MFRGGSYKNLSWSSVEESLEGFSFESPFLLLPLKAKLTQISLSTLLSLPPSPSSLCKDEIDLGGTGREANEKGKQMKHNKGEKPVRDCARKKWRRPCKKKVKTVRDYKSNRLLTAGHEGEILFQRLILSKSQNRSWNRNFARFHSIFTISLDFNPIFPIFDFFKRFNP